MGFPFLSQVLDLLGQRFENTIEESGSKDQMTYFIMGSEDCSQVCAINFWVRGSPTAVIPPVFNESSLPGDIANIHLHILLCSSAYG